MVLLAIGITGITAIFFVCWLFWMILRLMADGVNRLLAAPRSHAKSALASSRHSLMPCPDPICRRINPATARYCRQCGRSLGGRSLGLQSTDRSQQVPDLGIA